jgi:hypothetical protein
MPIICPLVNAGLADTGVDWLILLILDWLTLCARHTHMYWIGLAGTADTGLADPRHMAHMFSLQNLLKAVRSAMKDTQEGQMSIDAATARAEASAAASRAWEELLDNNGG